jgi:hypothetical protein
MPADGGEDMNTQIDDEGLRLALRGVRTNDDSDVQAAITRAEADLNRIRLGLQLVAAELPAPDAPRKPRRRASWRLLPVAVVTAAAAAALALVAIDDGGARHTPSASAGPHLLPDRFNYQAGSVGSSASLPLIPYSVPGLWGMSAASRTAAWIVGSTYTQGVAWDWNGTEWRSISLPKLPGHVELHSVATLSATDAWAVGSRSGPSDQFRVTHALIDHWDGTRWTVAPIPATGPSVLWAVSAQSPNNVWAVGATYHRNRQGKFAESGIHPLLLHWDGAAWRTVSVPWTRGGLELDQVATNGPDGVWVVSTGGQDVRRILVEHWNGVHWKRIPAPFGRHDPIRGFAATSANDAWAVGSYRQAGHSHPLAAHWNGNTWQIAPIPSRNTDSTLTDVVALTPSNVWALGQSQYVRVTHNPSNCRTPCTEIHMSFPVALFEHWNGHRWQIMPGAAPQMWEGGTMLAATKDGGAWAAGGCYWDDTITSWNGAAWKIATHPPDRTWHGTAPRSNYHYVTNCS